MATLYSGYSNSYRLKLVITESSQSVENNTTKLSWTLYLENGMAYFQLYSLSGSYLNLNKTRVWTADSTIISLSGYNQTTKLSSGTITVTHNSDGTRTVPVYAYYTMPGSDYYLPGVMTINASIDLTAIPRKSEINSVGDITTASTFIAVNLSRKYSGYTHTVTLSIGKTTIATWSDSWNGTKNLTLSSAHRTAMLNAIPASTSDKAKLTVETKNGSTSIGSVSKELTVTVDSAQVPTISNVSVVTKTPLKSGDITQLYQNFGTLTVTYTVAMATGTTVKTKTVAFSGMEGSVQGTESGTKTTTLLAFKSGDNQALIIKVTDKRGRTATWSKNYKVYAYKSIAFSEIFIGRTRDTSKEKTYADIETKIVTSSIKPSSTELNKVKLVVAFKERTATTYTTLATYTGSVGTWNQNNTLDKIFDIAKSYDLIITASDELSSSIMPKILSTADYSLVIGKNAVGVNMFPSVDKGLQTNGDVYDGTNGSRNISEIITAINGLQMLQTGLAPIGSALPANGKTSITVTFPKPYTRTYRIPKVFLTTHSAIGSVQYPMLAVSAINGTEFTINIQAGSDGLSLGTLISWVAIP